MVKQDSGYCLRITVVPTKNNKYSEGIQTNGYEASDKEERSRGYHKRDGAL